MEYAAPEQICGEDVDARADIYSLGCMLYELCTGQRPFGGETSHAVADSQLRCEPRAPSELVADLPCALEDLVLRMLAKRPDDRPATAAEVGEQPHAHRDPVGQFERGRRALAPFGPPRPRLAPGWQSTWLAGFSSLDQ